MTIFSCEHCDKTFPVKSKLTRHLNRKIPCYVKKEKLTCPSCNIIFSTLSNLNKHKNTKKHLKNVIKNKEVKNVVIHENNIQSTVNIKKNKKVKIPKVLKNLVWDTYIGEDNGSGPCYVCTKKINSKDFECGHIVAESKGGNTDIDNLRPVCRSCNGSVGNNNMDEFKIKYFSSKPKNTNNKKL
jgi:uncharacterized C2H2 Zn-finger protein